MYMWQFCKTEEEAKAFAKKNGRGVIYKNIPRSRTKTDYKVTLQMAEKPEVFSEEYPYVVCWNERAKA